MKDLISVIIPVYNVEKYLEKCIKSVINQTYKNLEIILVNDGSTDSSGEICNKFLKLDSRIILLNKVNEGLSAARNFGIQNSNGEYISFIDSDDFISDRMFEVLLNNINKWDCDISIVEKCDVFEDKEFDLKPLNEKQCYIYTKQEAMEKYFEGNFIPAWGKLYRRELFKNIKFPVGVLNEDEAIMIKLLDRCKKNIVYQNRQLYFYLKRKEGSITSTRKNIKNNIDWINNAYENTKYVKDKYPDILSKAEARYYKSILAILIRLVYLEDDEYKDIEKEYKRQLRNLKYKIFLNRNIESKLKMKFFVFLIDGKFFKVFKKQL